MRLKHIERSLSHFTLRFLEAVQPTADFGLRKDFLPFVRALGYG